MRTKVKVRAESVKVGDWLFVCGFAAEVFSFSEPHEVFKFPARTAVTKHGSLTLIDGDMVDVWAHAIEGMVYFDKHSHDAAQASQARAFKLQLQHQNSKYI